MADFIFGEDTEIEAIFEFNVYQSYKFGEGLTFKAGNVTLNKATATGLGGIKVGENLIVAEDGTLRVPNISNTVKGVVRMATDEEIVAAIATELAVSPKQLGNIKGDLARQLAAEIARAKAAEQALGTRITNETTRATNAETTLTNNLNAEIARAKGAESTLTTNLAAEVTRATTAETILQSNITAEVTRATEAEAALNTKIEAETTRATNAETTLTNNLSAEVTRATGIEAGLRTDLTAEVTRAKAAEATLTTNLSNEVTRATNAESTLTTNLSAEVTRAKVAEATLTTNLSNEVTRATGIEGGLRTDVNTINSKIPEQASSTNQLADKQFVNSSIATETANFVGTFSTLEELKAVPNPTNNDYGFVKTTDATGNVIFNRYKYVASSSEWKFEYSLNNSSFTAKQWNAINSGATTDLVTQITTNKNNISSIQGTIDSYGNIVTHNVSEFATAAQGSKADSAIQPNDNVSKLTNDAGYITKDVNNLTNYTTTTSMNTLLDAKADKTSIGDATISIQKNGTEVGNFTTNTNVNKAINIEVPTVNNATLTIQQDGGVIGTFTANSATDTVVNVTMDKVRPHWGNILGTLSDQTDLKNALDTKITYVDLGETVTLNLNLPSN